MKSRSLIGSLVVLAACASLTSAATITVGPSGRQYSKIYNAVQAAAAGDIIEIDPGEYWHGNTGVNPSSPTSSSPVEPFAYITKNLTLRGVGATRPLMNGMQASLNGQGIWVVQNGVTVTIENIEFENAVNPVSGQQNACGVYVQPTGSTVTIRNCLFHDCQNGVRSDATTTNLTIEGSIFHDNGIQNGQTHNMYVAGNTFVLRYCWSYNCHGGYDVKTRAKNNYFLYNRLGDEEGLALTNGSPHEGNAVDVPNGGLTYFIGNILQDATDANAGSIVRYGEEGVGSNDTQIYAVYNTILGRRQATITAFDAPAAQVAAYVADNVFVNTQQATLFNGPLVNNSAMINSNLMFFDHGGQNPPAVPRYMYDANGLDASENSGTANTYETWDVLNVRPIDPNTINAKTHAGITYQSLLASSFLLVPGANPMALPATGKDGTSLTPTSQYGFMPYSASGTLTLETRPNATDAFGAYSFAAAPVGNHQPVGTITSTLPQYIYEGWTVNLAATATDQDAGQMLSYQWTQTAGQGQTLTAPTALNTSFTVPQRSLTSRANEAMTFQFVATDNGSPAMSSTPVTASVTCYLCGDIDHDNAVILADLKLLVASWNTTPTSPNWNKAADLDGDNAIILADLKLLVANWNRSLP